MSSKAFNDINIENYTDKSIVVRGDTRIYKEDLKKLGGKYNGKLRDGPGWIFPKKLEKDVKSFILKGKRLVTEEEEQLGEEKTREWDKKRLLESKPDLEKRFNEFQKEMNSVIKILKKEIYDLKKNIPQDEIVIDLDSEEGESSEEEEKIPKKRLMR